MSAIGSYAVLTRNDFDKCLALARQVRSETTGKWIFKQTSVVGLEEFKQAWAEALLSEVDFGYSGYVIGNYLDAQEVVNGIELIDQESEAAQVLSKVFTAAFPFAEPFPYPDLPQDKLVAFCREEYGDDDAEGMVEAINAAHQFYRQGMAEITPEKMVVFIIN